GTAASVPPVRFNSHRSQSSDLHAGGFVYDRHFVWPCPGAHRIARRYESASKGCRPRLEWTRRTSSSCAGGIRSRAGLGRALWRWPDDRKHVTASVGESRLQSEKCSHHAVVVATGGSLCWASGSCKFLSEFERASWWNPWSGLGRSNWPFANGGG